MQSSTNSEEVKQSIESKFASKKKFLLSGLKRALIEEEILKKQKGHRKYKMYDYKYSTSRDWDRGDNSSTKMSRAEVELH